MNILRKSFAILSFLILLGFAMSLSGKLAPANTPQVKIGTVDLQHALQTVKKGKSARSKLEAEFNKRKKELKDEEEAIKKMHAAFQKQSMVMNDEARAKKQAEIQQRIIQLQQKTGQSQVEIQKREQDLTSPIVEGLQSTVSEIAKKKGYTVVLEKSRNMVLYSLPQDDLTAEVIGEFDKKK